MFSASASVRALLGFALVCCLFALQSCSSDTSPSNDNRVSLDSSAIVVNQGSFSSDNASLSRVHLNMDTVDLNWYSDANFGRKLGAVGNDIAFLGDTAFISVTNSHTVEVINAKTGKQLNTILFNAGEYPWKVVLLSSELGAASTTNGDGVRFFNPTTGVVLDYVHTGPAPEGICTDGQYLWVANSGYGTLRAKEAKAGTISVIDIATKMEAYNLAADSNVTELQISDDHASVFAYYQSLYTNPSAKQGVIQYSASSKLELARWTCYGYGYLNVQGSTVYLVGKLDSADLNLYILKLNTAAPSPAFQILTTLPSSVSPNGMSIDKRTGNLWLCDAADFSSRGNVLVYSPSGALLKSYQVGLNPGTVGFLR